MEEGGGVDDVQISAERRETVVCFAIIITLVFITIVGLLIRKDVSAEERRFQAVPVLEKVVAELGVLRAQICAVEVVRGCPGGDESADVLPEAAAEVEEGLRGLETSD